jgi:hypothetical protein
VPQLALQECNTLGICANSSRASMKTSGGGKGVHVHEKCCP